MRFLYDQFTRLRDEALEAYRGGDCREARYKLLRAAEYLYRLAQQGDEDMRASRVESARKLVEMATRIPEAQQQPVHAGKTRAAPEKLTSDSEDSAAGSRWIMTASPGVRFADIAGLDEVKELIRRRVLYPFQFPEVTARYRKRAGGGVLMYGPPGTGKTMLAKAIATELDATFFSVKCSDIMSKWVGDAEHNLRDLFSAARGRTPAVVFLDESEALVGRRGGDSTIMNRVIPEFLAQIDGVDTGNAGILLLGATNRPWDMDEAALRPGRFGESIYVALPDAVARRQMLEENLAGVPMEPGIDVAVLADNTDGFSGADISGLVARATDRPYSREVATGKADLMTAQDVETALKETRPSVTKAMLDRYDKFRRTRE